MHVGGPGQPTAAGRAIHWHADPRVRHRIHRDRRRAADDSLREGDQRAGQGPRNTSTEGTTPEELAQGEQRSDGLRRLPQRRRCTASRRPPEQAVDARHGRRPDQPHLAVRPARRRAAAESGLSRSRTRPRGDRRGIARRSMRRAAASIDAARRQAVDVAAGPSTAATCFPSMKVTLGVYPDNLGHTTSAGCFRCHDGSHMAKDGTTISARLRVLPQADRRPRRRRSNRCHARRRPRIGRGTDSG